MLRFKKLFSVLLILTLVLTGCAQAAAPAPAPAPQVEEPAPAEEEAPAVEEAAELPPAQKVEGDYTFENSGINSENLLDYLNREDTVYIDLRNYEDYSKKHFKNFEVIPFFGYIYNIVF